MNLNIYVNGGNYSPPQKKEIHVSMTYDGSYCCRKICSRRDLGRTGINPWVLIISFK